MKHLVFVGAGHAHLFPCTRTREFIKHGISVTLIAPGRFWYSGMGPGMVSRFYEAADDTVDVQALVERGGGTFVKDKVVRIDTAARELHLRGGELIRYDALSLNIGSEVPMEMIPGAREFGVAVKPIKNLLTLRESLTTDAHAEPLRIVVIGGGAAGSEVCANISHLLAESRREANITLISATDRLVSEAPPRASAIMADYLRCRDVEMLFNTKAARVENGELILESGRRIAFDKLVVAIGIRAPALLREARLLCADDGSMRVNEFLRSTTHPEIFGAGDCVCVGEKCLPRIGVYAVRQGPVLHRNLLAFLTDKPLTKFRPQKQYLLILNLADGTGLLTRGRLVVRSRWAFWVKDWLDRRFVRKYQLHR